jgi:hypothetical protein
MLFFQDEGEWKLSLTHSVPSRNTSSAAPDRGAQPAGTTFRLACDMPSLRNGTDQGGGWTAAIRVCDARSKEARLTALVVLLILAALLVGGLGLFVAALKWPLIIAVILLVVGLVLGFLGRGRSRA